MSWNCWQVGSIPKNRSAMKGTNFSGVVTLDPSLQSVHMGTSLSSPPLLQPQSASLTLLTCWQLGSEASHSVAAASCPCEHFSGSPKSMIESGFSTQTEHGVLGGT